MDPNVAVELAVARTAELRTAGSHGTSPLPRITRRTHRPVLGTLSSSAFDITQRLRHRAAQLTALTSPRQPTPDPCC